ncbi:MAG: hypothetical protein KDI25_12015, partial [Pseudomonadales bacterium]|nr:hypothetical protein [Pseudomonadales bacterium]
MPMLDLFKPELPQSPGDIRRWCGLHGSSLSLAVSRIAQQHAGPIVLLSANTEEADTLRRELGFFCDPGTPLHGLPDWETLPYDNFSAHQDIVSD